MIRTILSAALLALSTLAAKADVDIVEVTSPGGIEAWLVQDASIPFVALDIRFRGGASLDRPDAVGATNLMMALLEEGAGEMDARDFAIAAEGLAAAFRFDTRGDTASVTARMLTENRDEAVGLLRAALVSPRFDGEAIARVRGQVLASIEGNLRDPAQIARAALDARTFAGHPYARPVEGTLDSVAALTREDILAAHRAALVQDRVVVGAAGDITPDALGRLLDRVLGGLPGSSPRPLPGPAPFEATGGVEVIDFPAPQSTVAFVQPGLPQTHPDFFPAFVLSQIIGGSGFDSRLMQEVRVARGLTYGIYSYLANFAHADIVAGQFSSSNALVAEAIEVVRQEWADITRHGVTADELEAAQRYMTGAYPLRFAGNSNLAGILAGMQMRDMPIDYINTRNDRVEAVTLGEINRVAADLLTPEGLQFVVVGQPDGLEPTN